MPASRMSSAYVTGLDVVGGEPSDDHGDGLRSGVPAVRGCRSPKTPTRNAAI